MSDVKAKLLAEIESKIKRKRELKSRSINSKIEEYVISFLNEMEDLRAKIAQTSVDIAEDVAYYSQKSLLGQLRTIDPECRIELSWHSAADELPRIIGVTIQWSNDYQNANNVEPELFVDVVSLLFK